MVKPTKETLMELIVSEQVRKTRNEILLFLSNKNTDPFVAWAAISSLAEDQRKDLSGEDLSLYESIADCFQIHAEKAKVKLQDLKAQAMEVQN